MSTPNEVIADTAAEKLAEALRKEYKDAVIGISNYVAFEGPKFFLAAIEEAQPQELRDEQGRKVIVSSGD
jgi:hypothetical protein